MPLTFPAKTRCEGQGFAVFWEEGGCLESCVAQAALALASSYCGSEQLSGCASLRKLF